MAYTLVVAAVIVVGPPLAHAGEKRKATLRIRPNALRPDEWKIYDEHRVVGTVRADRERPGSYTVRDRNQKRQYEIRPDGIRGKGNYEIRQGSKVVGRTKEDQLHRGQRVIEDAAGRRPGRIRDDGLHPGEMLVSEE